MTRHDRLVGLRARKTPWNGDARFASALEKFAARVGESTLQYGSYLHFFPNWLRVTDGQISEVVYPFGKIEDPLFGLAMVWIYDCYPFVHTGFVEQYLVRHNVPREDFAICLGIQALSIIAKELPFPSPGDATPYANALWGLVDRALSWL